MKRFIISLLLVSQLANAALFHRGLSTNTPNTNVARDSAGSFSAGAVTLGGTLNMSTNSVTNVVDPSSAQDAATKNYVDNAINGLNWKTAAEWATAAPLAANTYSNGASGVGATLTEIGVGALSIDGNSPIVGDRVLIKNEVIDSHNGIYVVTAAGSGIAAYVLTRTVDFNQSSNIAEGDTVFVISGTANATTAWALITTGAITVGTTSLVFAQVSGPGSYTAGTGISILGTTISLVTPVALANGGTHADLSATGGASQVLKQTSAGANVTVGQLACGDLSNASASCSTDATNANNLSSGTVPVGRLGNAVTSISNSGSPALMGNVTLSAGSNIVLTQVGQNITITATSSGSSAAIARFTASGGIGAPVDWFDGGYVCTTAQSLTNVQLGMNDSGTVGYTGVEIYKNGVDRGVVTVTANGTQNSVNSTLASPISCVSGDVFHPGITNTPISGTPQDLTVQFQFQ